MIVLIRFDSHHHVTVELFLAVDDTSCVMEAVNTVPGAFLHPNNRDFGEMCVARTTVLERLNEIAENVCATDVERQIVRVSILSASYTGEALDA